MRVLVTGGSGFIGTHLVRLLLSTGHDVVNLDVNPPDDADLLDCYRCASILNLSEVKEVLSNFQPTHVVHLAALAVMEGKSIEDFRANTEGTKNVISAVKSTPSVERLIITSTQHVRRPGSGPASSDDDYDPLMLYGESKVITEQVTRTADIDCVWTIVRPTLVWGPGHLPLANGLFKLMKQGRYIHPSNDTVKRSYGYVKNVAWQIERLLLVDPKTIDRKTLYVADGNLQQIDWINAMSVGLTGKKVRTVPLWSIKALAKLGDLLKLVGLPFPMFTSRLKNLTTNNVVPVEATEVILGPVPISLEQGIEETVEWFREYHKGASE